MANADNAIGFVPIKHQKGGDIRIAHYVIADQYDTDLARNDVVKITGDDKTIEASPAGTVTNRGIFVGCSYIDVRGQPIYSEHWIANTVTKNGAGAVAMVWDDPGIVYRVQADTLAAADVGLLADWDAGTPNPDTRLSGLELVASGAAATGKSMRILGLSDVEGNSYGAHAQCDVIFAEHDLLTGSAGAGGT